MNAVICGFVRSPFTPAKKGALAKVRPDDLAAEVIKGLITKTGVDPSLIDDVICGCAFPEGEQGFNIGRMLTFMSDLPKNVAGQTVNRWCGSSMEAIHIAAGNIAIGKGEAFICAGVESMTRIPMGGYNPLPNPKLFATMPEAYISMGLTAENVAKQYKLERQEQEEFALESHKKAAAADFSDEIITINGVSTDGCVRPGSTADDLQKLDPAFDVYGTVTAGTSSPLTDGSAAVLVVSEKFADQHGLLKLARIKSCAVVGLEPAVMGLGPIFASRKALENSSVSVDQLDIIEINEAFAAQSIPCCNDLGLNRDKVNIEGGAIALGHPLGASGARITGKAAQLLNREKGKYALATACIGGGMGIATVLEAI
ncbi:MAG: thiolase family protein [Rickettsiales bacterium]|nr:thiolase family protein [Rickettsiales bacterium]